MAEAVARTQGEAGGGLAQTPPPPPRPGTFDTVAADGATLSGQPSRAVVGPSHSHDPRRHQRLAREGPAASTPRGPPVRAAAPQASCGRAEAEAAAAPRRALQSASHRGEGGSEERPQDGPGRPSQQPPRVVKVRRAGRPGTLHERAAVRARTRQEAGGLVRWTKVPTAGERAPRAGEGRRASQEQHGVEQPLAFFQAPVMVHSRCRKQPERSEALGLGVGLARRRWRLVERTRRGHGETPGNPWMGGAKQATQQQ